ncbi:MAG TPA: SurA N-terminal domain-containing protein [Blastocatellia bacterium]
MKFVILTLLAALFIAIPARTARAQDPELVNQIIAQVNNDIITRYDYLNALREFREELGRQMSGKNEAEVNAEYEKLKPTVLDLMIEDLLLEQKAKELNIDVEAEVNQELIRMAKDNGFNDPIAFQQQLKSQGIDPDEARATLRKNFQHHDVLEREVFMPLFQNVTDKEKRDFYDSHKDAFTIPGDISLSEIFLPLENETANEVEQRAKRLVTELRAGGDFEEAVAKNSPPTRASRAQNGKMGSFKMADLKPEVKAAIENLKVGEVTDPIRLQDGFQIIRLDERKEAIVHAFDEQAVQRSITGELAQEKMQAAQKKFTKELRDEAYIEIKEGYKVAEAGPDKAGATPAKADAAPGKSDPPAKPDAKQDKP